MTMKEENIIEAPLLPPTLPRWWRVLPSMILLMMIGNIDGLILNDFIIYRYADYYRVNSSSTQNTRDLCLNATRTLHNRSTLISTTTSQIPISTTMSWNDIIQASTARLNVYISLAATIPAILVSILLGANCDRIGRKPLIALPYVGKTIRYAILTAVAYYDLSNIWIVLSVMFDGFFGTSGLNILSSFAYVTDCTNDKTRTAAIIITDVGIATSKVVPLLTMGMYLQHPNFTQSMIATFCLSLGGLLFCIFLQPESNLEVQNLNLFQQLMKTEFRAVTKIFQVFMVKREGHKQRSLLILVGTHLSIVVFIMGPTAIYYLYLYGAPFCMDSFGVSLNNVAQTVAIVILTIPFTLTIARRTDHLILPALGCMTYIIQLVLFGVANHIWLLYVAVCIGAWFNILTPIIRSRITKLVEPNEYAVVFILAGVLESGGFYAISALANEIYQVSLSFYQGLVYFVFSFVGLLSIIFMLILYILERRQLTVKKTVSVN